LLYFRKWIDWLANRINRPIAWWDPVSNLDSTLHIQMLFLLLFYELDNKDSLILETIYTLIHLLVFIFTSNYTKI
jgi:hypothetical protein